jgi:uncharacterized membrane protein YqjE
MSVPDSTDSGQNPGLFVSLRSFWSILVAILYTRLDLATAELEDEASRAVQLLVVSIAALLCTGMAAFFVMFLFVVTFWDNRVLVLSIVCVINIVASVVLYLVARNMVLNRPKFLSQTLAELRKDVEGLRPAPAAKKDEVKS